MNAPHDAEAWRQRAEQYRAERDEAVKRYGALWADVKNARFDTIFTKKLQGGILARADKRARGGR